ncbi:hypothetical protein [Protaetiibacter mangrovi]|uniref:Lipoprotein n=1 Tax=Protaetiibacter mangrovi TaxID=2970926 RepID=A0ABT1ZCM7_9MICO|nr:hypothetical protein [Protaetiibacter mangrovi]MCS0498463.1 hypothetical protein [Protaetiibacter mangrovi]TPX03786.1 hypothetical protein FJ656_15285 [Schumannella luteola]
MRTTTRGALAATLLLPLALALTGCANPIEQLIESGTGTQIDTDGDGGFTIETDDGAVQVGGSTELPADFPGELPLPDGTLLSTVTAEGQWSLSYDGVSAGSAEEILAYLDANGFEQLALTQTADACQFTYQSDQWVVTGLWGSGESGAGMFYAVAAR